MQLRRHLAARCLFCLSQDVHFYAHYVVLYHWLSPQCQSDKTLSGVILLQQPVRVSITSSSGVFTGSLLYSECSSTSKPLICDQWVRMLCVARMNGYGALSVISTPPQGRTATVQHALGSFSMVRSRTRSGHDMTASVNSASFYLTSAWRWTQLKLVQEDFTV